MNGLIRVHIELNQFEYDFQNRSSIEEYATIITTKLTLYLIGASL